MENLLYKVILLLAPYSNCMYMYILVKLTYMYMFPLENVNWAKHVQQMHQLYSCTQVQ